MTASEETVLNDALAAMTAFRKAFGCELKLDSLAEVYAASHLNLKLIHGNNPGFDARAENGKRYQIKYRAGANNIDTRDFNFDYMVLVTLTDAYEVKAMYRITQQQARHIFTERATYHKWQTSMKKFIGAAERL